MESLFIRDFRRGLDTRRSELTQLPGSLEVLTNGFINQGGEIENRKAFVRTAQIANSFGLQPTASGLLTFGSANNPGGYPLNIGTVGVPIQVNYQQLKHPQDLFDGTTNVVPMTEVVHSTEFRGKAFVIAKFGSSGTFGYYDGTLVYDFTNGYIFSFLNTNDKIAQFIEQMIDRTTDYTASTASNVVTVTGPVGQPFVASATETTAGSGTLTAVNTSAPTNPIDAAPAVGSFMIVAGSSNAGTNKISSVSVNAVTITSAAVDWTTSNEITAGLIAANINANTSSPDYTAEAVGNVVTIKALASAGAGPNDYVVSVVAAGDVCIGKAQFQVLSTTPFTSAQCYINGANIGGTVNWNTSASQTAADIATAIRGAGTYTANAKGAVISVSKLTTASNDAPIPIYFLTDPAGGIIEIETGTGSGGLLSVSIAVTNSVIGNAGSLFKRRFFIALNVRDGIPPYQSPVWVGGTVVRIDATHYYVDGPAGTGPYVNSPAGNVPPAVYCTVADSGGNLARSNTL